MRAAVLLVFVFCAGVVAPAAIAGLPPVRASLIKDLDPTPTSRSSDPQRFRTLGDRVYFVASAVGTGEEVYSTDAAGDLRLLGDIAPGPDGSVAEPVALIGDRVIVSADDRVAGRQLWSLRTDGGGAARLTSFGSTWTTVPGAAKEIVALPGRSLLQVLGQGYGLWSTDGTPGGTFALPEEAGFPISVVFEGCALDGAAIVTGGGTVDGLGRTVLARTNGLPGGGSVLAVLPGDALAVSAASANGYCHFLYRRQNGGWLLWRSNGTPAGTSEVAASTTGRGVALAANGAEVYLTDNTSDHRTRLQRIAATGTGLELVADLPGPLDGGDGLTAYRGRLLFYAFYGSGGSFAPALFASDGTPAGTRRLYPQQAGQTLPSSDRVFPIGDALIIDNPGTDTRIELADGSISLVGSESFSYSDSAALGDARIGSTGNLEREVWITNGRSAGTRRLHDIWPETQGSLGGTPAWTAIGDTLYFAPAQDPASSGTLHAALWRSDGTEDGTRPLSTSFHPEQVPRLVRSYGGSGVLFTANFTTYFADAALGSAFAVGDTLGDAWLQSYAGGWGAVYLCGDGFALCGVNPAAGGAVLSNESFMRVHAVGEVGGTAVFWRDQVPDVWRSDGTVPGTYRILEGRRLLADPDPSQDAVLNGKLYFVACTVSNACDLVATDGTAAGTSFVRPMPVGALVSAGRAGDRLVFGVELGSTGQLWSTDGTAAGTVLLLDRSTGRYASTGDHVHLYSECAACKQRYVVTDGTPAGTRAVELPGALGATRNFIAALGPDAVVFSCESPRRGNELCLASADGGAIAALPEIYPGSQSATPFFLGRTASAVYFSAEDGSHGREPWQIRRLPEGIFADDFD